MVAAYSLRCSSHFVFKRTSKVLLGAAEMSCLKFFYGVITLDVKKLLYNSLYRTLNVSYTHDFLKTYLGGALNTACALV